MKNIPQDFLFTPTHEWIRQEGELISVGITDFAQSQLSDLTYVELPSVGDQLAVQDEAAVVESVKAASDIYAPLAGVVEAVNEQLAEHPELINTDPYGEGWLFKMRLDATANLDALIGPEAYESLVPDEA